MDTLSSSHSLARKLTSKECAYFNNRNHYTLKLCPGWHWVDFYTPSVDGEEQKLCYLTPFANPARPRSYRMEDIL